MLELRLLTGKEFDDMGWILKRNRGCLEGAAGDAMRIRMRGGDGGKLGLER
jgi:hypothetical protein